MMPALVDQDRDLKTVNHQLEKLEARDRLAWSFEHLPGGHLMSSSFGVQSAVLLHLANDVAPGLPVVFLDTGYHFAETYRFVDELSQRLRLNLKVYRPQLSSAWQEARHGRRWDQGQAELRAYNHENKVEPMRRALFELSANTWFSGVRRVQAPSRQQIDVVQRQWGRLKVHPLVDWSDRQVHEYLSRHRLPYHPLRERGYISIGDWHTTRSLSEVDSEQQTRFHGLLRECGLHEVPSPGRRIHNE